MRIVKSDALRSAKEKWNRSIGQQAPSPTSMTGHAE